MGIFDDLPNAAQGGQGAEVPSVPIGMFDDLPGRAGAPERPMARARGLKDLIAPQEQPEVGTGSAAALGAGSGVTANFMDELAGLAHANDAQPAWLGPFKAPVGIGRLIYEGIAGSPGSTTKAYQEGRDKVRRFIEAAQTQHPIAYGAGNVTGALATIPIAPGLTVARGAGVGARAANAAATGATYGGLYGAGEGEGAADTLAQAGKGSAIGAATGAVATPVVEGLIRGGAGVINTIRGAINPEAEAARRVGAAIATDSPGVARPVETAASAVERGQQGGVPLVLADAGGETTRALARSAANTSTEARQALQEGTGPRFQHSADRFEQTIGHLTGQGAPDAVLAREQLETLARQQNRPAYARAYAAGDRPVISPELERIMSSPDVEDAMRSAARTGKAYAVNEGQGAFNSRVQVTPDGRVNFGNGPSGAPTYPNVQYWDYVQRELSNAEGQANRAGRAAEAARIGETRRALNGELDNIVPEFGQARRGAATFFGADDALTAGQNFVSSRLSNTEARQAVGRMSPAERQLFAHGFASDLVKSVREIPMADRATLISKAFLSSPASRERMDIALGPDGARRVEAFLRLERMMDQTRFAVSGNSTTMRQLAEAGLAGGVGGAWMTGDTAGFGAGAITGALLRHGAARINGRVATQVGQLLASDNPDAIRQAAQSAVRNPQLLDAIRRSDSFIARAVGSNAPAIAGARADEDK